MSQSSLLFRIESALKIGDMSSAYLLAKELVQELEYINDDRELLAAQLTRLGFICTALDYWTEARKHFNNAHSLCIELGDLKSASSVERALQVLTLNDTNFQQYEVA